MIQNLRVSVRRANEFAFWRTAPGRNPHSWKIDWEISAGGLTASVTALN